MLIECSMKCVAQLVPASGRVLDIGEQECHRYFFACGIWSSQGLERWVAHWQMIIGDPPASKSKRTCTPRKTPMAASTYGPSRVLTDQIKINNAPVMCGRCERSAKVRPRFRLDPVSSEPEAGRLCYLARRERFFFERVA